ncbi:MAG: metal-dependent hydrolase [Leptolyngbyaceae cyanobacterium MAG.088]|nr:metal-dependent hydrolase [Leptolyngbyaceae cyanobacterium MAG.088]
MPSPIAHAVSGYAIVRGIAPSRVYKLWPLALYAVFVAIAADFDFVPHIVAGIDTHRGFTHSLAFAIAFSVIVSRLMSQRTSTKWVRLFTLTLMIYGSHLLLDFFTQGGSGVPLLWPVSNQTFQAAFPLFPAVHHSNGVFDSIHLIFLSFELAYTVILLWSLSRWQAFNHQRQHKTSHLNGR